MKKNYILVISCILLLITCSDDAVDQQTNFVEIEIPEYYGTYLYNDNDCGGSDIQYATISDDGITFFDFLGDNCDDTVSCYFQDFYELTEVTSDTFLIITHEGSNITNGEVYLTGDSVITVSFDGITGHETYTWGKIKDDIYSFTPVCDQAYGYTKDAADMMIYAVSDGGDLLWKNYIHGGIWDLASSVTPMHSGGFMVLGAFHSDEHSGCCYTDDYDHRDIIKLDNDGTIEWQKEIEISNSGYSEYDIGIGTSLIETSFNDLVFLTVGAPGNNKLMIVMMDSEGEIKWTRTYFDEDLNYSSGQAEILETDDGDLALVAYSWPSGLIAILDYYSGEILEENDLPCDYCRQIIKSDDGFAILGTGGSDNYVTLVKVDESGDSLWSKVYDDPSLWEPLDLIQTEDGGFLLFGYSQPAPYATLVKTDDEGNEEWRKRYNDYVGGGKGWIHKTEDGGYFMVSGYAVTKLDSECEVEWNAAGPAGFDKNFNNGMVSGINHDMKQIQGGAIMVGYGSASWE